MSREKRVQGGILEYIQLSHTGKLWIKFSVFTMAPSLSLSLRGKISLQASHSRDPRKHNKGADHHIPVRCIPKVCLDGNVLLMPFKQKLKPAWIAWLFPENNAKKYQEKRRGASLLRGPSIAAVFHWGTENLVKLKNTAMLSGQRHLMLVCQSCNFSLEWILRNAFLRVQSQHRGQRSGKQSSYIWLLVLTLYNSFIPAMGISNHRRSELWIICWPLHISLEWMRGQEGRD